MVQALFNGKMRISFYAENPFTLEKQEVWATTCYSNGGWTGSVRDWTTDSYLSNWDTNNTFNEDKFTWPLNPNIYYPETFEVVIDKEKQDFTISKWKNDEAKLIDSFDLGDTEATSLDDFIEKYQLTRMDGEQN